MLRCTLLAPLVLCFSLPALAANPNWPDGIPDDGADMSDPANMPDDPGYFRVDREGDTVVRVHGAWNLWSFVPQLWIDTGPPIRSEELILGTGMHADRAWLLSPGRRDVIVAVLDSGAYWDNRDLVNKYYLNVGELDRDGARPCVPDDFTGDPLDVNDDGIFNVQDYDLYKLQCSWDIDAEGNGNGLIDPEDLLVSSRYSDGVDDDGNGYIDDISGWDFFWNDNNAYDDTRYGHGNGEARDSVAEGNNGQGGIGACPECTALMVRVGDSFMADGNDFGSATAFAVDSGASVIQAALGGVNNTSMSQQAIEYAYANNVVVIASAADELSFHHNPPGTNNHTVYVHAVTHDTSSDRSRATTFLNFNNCTNYGAQLLLSTPAASCSSEAVGKSAGHAGLIYSYALDQALDPPLTAEEVRGLMVMSVDDIDVPESQPDHPGFDGTKYPSREGWDLHFGYGRNNARASLELIRDDAVPPEIDIVEPLWFDVIDANEVTTIDVTGRIGDRLDGLDPRYDSYDYTIEVAAGAEPAGNEFSLVTSGTTAGMSGLLATLDVEDFDVDGVPLEPHDFSVTVRIRACVPGTGGFGSGNCGEFRKTFFIHRDPSLYDAFPLSLGASGESSPVFFDLDEDGADELIVATSDGIMHAFLQDGSELAGWPVELDLRKGFRDDLPNDHRGACAYRTAPREGCNTRATIDPVVRQPTLLGSPAVGNLEGDDDGAVEVLVATYDGWVYAFDASGARLPGFPVRTDPALSANTDRDNVWDEGIASGVVLYDLDWDDDLEIIVGAMDQHVYVWHHDGSLDEGFPVYCRDTARDADEDITDSQGARIFATPAVGDLDNDGEIEIIVGTNEAYDAVESRYYILHAAGNAHEDGPFEWVDLDAEGPGPGRNFSLQNDVIPLVGRGVPAAATLADVDFDGFIEFAVEGVGAVPVMRRWDGFEVVDTRFMDISTEAFGPDSDVSDNFSYTLISHGAFGYLDDSGDLSFVKSAAGIDFVLAFIGGGIAGSFDHQLAAWNTRTAQPLQAFPRRMEDWQFFSGPTIVDLDDDDYPEIVAGSGGYLLRAFNYRGEELAGFPKQTGGWIVATAAVGDFDGDDFYDVATITRAGNLFVWRTEGSTDGVIEWLGFGHDHWNTSNYETPIPGQDRPQLPGDDGDADVGVDVGSDVGADVGGEDAGTDAPSEDLDGDPGAGQEDVESDQGGPSNPPGGGGDGGGCSVASDSQRLPLELLILGLVVALRRKRRW